MEAGHGFRTPLQLSWIWARVTFRGGEKNWKRPCLPFHLTQLNGRICADVGASTGGFTDCLLQHGAEKVYAVDVGYGMLHWKLRNDPRVVVMERTNARYVTGFGTCFAGHHRCLLYFFARSLPPPVGWFAEAGGEVVALIKPQFEAARADVSRGDGVIHDPMIHRQVLLDILTFASSQEFGIRGLIRSPLKGQRAISNFWCICSISRIQPFLWKRWFKKPFIGEDLPADDPET
jgi:23S rRNA (cytidine1920-2'-O)/16S rRNA (cytidine1409-2'-O)-methyltransferase